MKRIRVATYNIHRCLGLDRRILPSRIAEVLQEIDADVVALQEVLAVENSTLEADQARFLADTLEMHPIFGPTSRMRGGLHGNLILSRLPVRASNNHDISVRGRQRRGCLRADVQISHGHLLHVFNVHLGTAFLERRHQARKLVNGEILNCTDISGARIMLGDFNEWTRGLTTRLLTSQLRSADIRVHLSRRKTYPGILPLLHLDHIYFDETLELEALSLHRSRKALVASDHLPLVADLKLPARA